MQAIPQAQLVGRFQVHPSPDCEHLARELKCETLGAILASDQGTNPWILPQ